MPATAYVSDGRGIGEVVVPRALEDVFDYISDLRHMVTWWSEHQTYRRLLGSGGPGTLYAWTMQRGPIPFAPPFGGLTVVTVLERPTRFAYRVLSPGLLTRMTYGFAATPAGTHVSLESRSAAYRLAFFARNFPGHVASALDTLAVALTSAA
jgi:hypothetical protein